MSKATYVVVDMHKITFHKGRPDRIPLVRAVGRVIDHAIKMRCPIVFVRFGPFHDIVPELWNKVADYKPHDLVSKRDFNGAREIKDCCELRQFDTKIFRVCGVAADLCVRETSGGLCKLFPHSRVEVLMDACDTPDKDWKRYQKGPARYVHLIPRSETE